MLPDQLQDLEFIDRQLLKIRDLLNPVDAYYVSDAIITSLSDELLSEHISNLLKTMGYKENKIAKVITLIAKIQNLNT